MNEIVNKSLLVGDKFCLKCISDNLDLHKVLVEHLEKTKKDHENLEKQEIDDIFINMN